MKHRDYAPRIVKFAGGVVIRHKVERQYCPKCMVVRRRLTNDLYPYIHYSGYVVDGVLLGRITPDTVGFEDYPCEMTMKRWKTRKMNILSYREIHPLRR